MTTFQKLIKHAAIALALCITAGIIGTAVLALGGLALFFAGDGEEISGSEMKAYSVNQDIREIYIEACAADCEIIEGDAFSVESNSGRLTVIDRGGKLSVDDNTRNITKDNIKVKITVPYETRLEKAVITSDAGDIIIRNLTAASLDIECGAGDISATGIKATFRSEIDGGAGDIRIEGSLNNAEIDIGVGDFEFTGELTGDSDIDSGVGETKLSLNGAEEKYTLLLDNGMGTVKINGEVFLGSAVYGKGENRIEVDSGIGDVELTLTAAA